MSTSKASKHEGYVYIMTNPTMKNMIKIGFTLGDPKKRARAISSTGVPGYWEVEYQLWTPDCSWVERSTHRYFSEKRAYNNREFFRVNPSEAQVVIKHFADSLLELKMTPKGTPAHVGGEKNLHSFSPDIDWYVYPEREEIHLKTEAERHRKMFEDEKNEELREEARKVSLQREQEDFERRKKSRANGFRAFMTVRQQCHKCKNEFTVTLMRHEQGATCPFCNQPSPTNIQW